MAAARELELVEVGAPASPEKSLGLEVLVVRTG
jgi:hypothetical protein